MRDLRTLEIFRHRDLEPKVLGPDPDRATSGVFVIHGMLRIIASVDLDTKASIYWEHVSVSLEHRCPTWEEMSDVKIMFFKDDEMTVQYHPPRADHVNCHPYCLHMWRMRDFPMPCPHKDLVGGGS